MLCNIESCYDSYGTIQSKIMNYYRFIFKICLTILNIVAQQVLLSKSIIYTSFCGQSSQSAYKLQNFCVTLGVTSLCFMLHRQILFFLSYYVPVGIYTYSICVFFAGKSSQLLSRSKRERVIVCACVRSSKHNHRFQIDSISKAACHRA